MSSIIPSVLKAIPHENFFLEIEFSDGEKKVVDIKPFIKNGVSSALKNKAFFNDVFVENGFISWKNGFDFCPEFLKNHV